MGDWDSGKGVLGVKTQLLSFCVASLLPTANFRTYEMYT